ncbi:MAG: RNA polymerase sigma factor RpoD/SigA, partial [Elusimicrobia bacterium]|nr:RNA polymerase sigma factor RpoD/SigA [Elusimicrobiota bacterium]
SQLYFREIKNIPKLTKEQIDQLWKRSRSGDKKSRKRLVELNLRLVIPVTRRYIRRGIEFLDLVEEGNIGLIRAVEKFNPDKKISFSTYANYWIDQAIRRAVEDKSKIIRIPAHMWDNIHNYLKKRDKIITEKGREPSVQELAQSLKLSKKQVKDIIDATALARQTSSLDAPVDVDGDILVKDVIPDHKSLSPESVTEIVRESSGIEDALKYLDPRAKLIIELRFGIGGKQSESLGIISDQLKISRERVRQIEEAALKRLKFLFLKLKMLDKEQSDQLSLDSRFSKNDRRKLVDRRQGAPDMRRRKIERRKGKRRSGKDRRQ